MKIIGTGLSGLVGSRVVELLQSDHTFVNLSLETGIDITRKDVVFDRITRSDAPWVFHFAAITDLDAAEKERDLGNQSNAWRVNVIGTHHVVDAARASGKRVLYLSTDFVFDGNNGPYTEESEPNPQSWYAVTKFEGEKIVCTLGQYGLIIRMAFPYRYERGVRPDFVHRIIDELRNGQHIQAPTDQLFTPTFIDDVVALMRTFTKGSASGVYHAVGSQVLSPFEAAVMIAQTFGLNTSHITPTTWKEYYHNRAPRPKHAVLKHDKIDSLGIYMKSFIEVLQGVKNV